MSKKQDIVIRIVLTFFQVHYCKAPCTLVNWKSVEDTTKEILKKVALTERNATNSFVYVPLKVSRKFLEYLKNTTSFLSILNPTPGLSACHKIVMSFFLRSFVDQ